jgi:hypothetical protein
MTKHYDRACIIIYTPSRFKVLLFVWLDFQFKNNQTEYEVVIIVLLLLLNFSVGHVKVATDSLLILKEVIENINVSILYCLNIINTFKHVLRSLLI